MKRYKSKAYNKSILQEPDAIKCWLDTPAGYYKGTNRFGLDFNAIVFKNSADTSYMISRVIDKMIFDLGAELVSLIDEISLFVSDDNDEVRLVVDYAQRRIVSRNLMMEY